MSESFNPWRHARRFCAAFAGAALALLSATLSPADTLELTSGRAFEGRLIEQSDQQVVFEVQRYGATLRQTYRRDQVAKVIVPQRDGVGIAVLPAVGTIGAIPGDDGEGCVTAQGVAAALDAARAAGAARAVLLIDSPGGRIDAMVRIIAVLQREGQLPVTAYVRRGISAAAIIALSCDEMIVAPGATLGAAVPLQIGPDGTPQNVEAKFRSAYLATVKQAAQAAGRAPDVLLAMADERTVLYRTSSPQGPDRLTARRTSGASVYKPAGEVLTLTDDEALRFGVARARAATLNDVPAALGIEAWHGVGRQPWHVMKNAGIAARAAQRRELSGRMHGVVAPVLDDLEQQRDQVLRRINAVKTYRQQLDEALTRGRERLTNARHNRLWSTRQAKAFRDEIEAQHAEGIQEADTSMLQLQVLLDDLDDAMKRARALGGSGGG